MPRPVFARLFAILTLALMAACAPQAPVAPGGFSFKPGVTYMVAHVPAAHPRGVLGNAGFCKIDATGVATATLGVLESPACLEDGAKEGPLGVHSRFALVYTHVALPDGSSLYIGEASRLLNSAMSAGEYAQIYRASTVARPGFVAGRHPVISVETGMILNVGRLGGCVDQYNSPWQPCLEISTLPAEDFTSFVKTAVPSVDPARLRPDAMRIVAMTCTGSGKTFTGPGSRCVPVSG